MVIQSPPRLEGGAIVPRLNTNTGLMLRIIGLKNVEKSEQHPRFDDGKHIIIIP